MEATKPDGSSRWAGRRPEEADGPRVGVLLWDDACEPSSLSGMPWNMGEALRRAGCELLPIMVGPLGSAPVFRSAAAAAPRDVPRRLYRTARRAMEAGLPGLVRGRCERRALASARLAARRARDAGVDVVFGPCMSRPLAYLEDGLPVVYASDATASLLLGTYDDYRRRGRGWREAMIDLETRAFGRADRIALASDRTAQSAVEDHGADRDRISIVPLGANIAPDGISPGEPEPPSPGDLRLLLSAADPERKRLGLCVDIAAELRSRGWRATLHYIGPERPECSRPEVEWAGRLSLGDPEDSAVHRSLLERCHLAILPSVAEMFGIAPIESAAFGRPAVVSDAGGLPTVVEDGVTGRVIPVDTPLAGWVDAIESTCARPDRYLDFSRAARARFESTLNWDAWGRSLRRLIEQVA